MIETNLFNKMIKRVTIEIDFEPEVELKIK